MPADTVETGLRLFSYTGWVKNDDGTESLLGCTLNHRFDRYEVGAKVQVIKIDFFVGKMIFLEDDRELDTFDIKYTFYRCL